MKASTILGDALRNFGDLCDLHPEWDTFACLISKDGLRLNFNATGSEAFPIDVARALLDAATIDHETDPADRDQSRYFHDEIETD